MSQPSWSLQLYELQHRIWPTWSASEAGAGAAMDFLIRWLGLEPGARILDLGCGVGRELVALAERGMAVAGLDISAELVGRARARVEAAGLELGGEVVVELGDLLAPSGRFERGSFDSIMAWDSTLNIFSLEQARDALRAWLPYLAPGGRVCVQQLHERYWSRPRGPFVLEGDAVGPGRTVRCYRFEGGRLLDEVRYEPPDGPAQTLPTQELHLYPPAQLEAALTEIGLVEVCSVGSEGHAWTEPRPPNANSSMIITTAKVS